MIRETSYTGARKNLAALMDQVTDTHEPVVIRRRGKERRRSDRSRRPERLDGNQLPAALADERREAARGHGPG